MKLSFVGATLLISVLSTGAQHYIPDFPPPWPFRHFSSSWPLRRFGSEMNPDFRDDSFVGKSIPQRPPSWFFRRFGSEGNPDFRDDSFVGKSIPQRPPSWPFRRFGPEWPFRRFSSEGPLRCFGSDWPFRRFGLEWPFRRFGLEWPLRRFGSDGPLRRFGSDGDPGFRDDAYISKSILRNPLFWFPKPFGSAWPFRHFDSSDRIRPEKLIHLLGKLVEICKKIFDQRRPWESRRNHLKIMPTFKICCGNPLNLYHQPPLSTYGYPGFPQGYPFYLQDFPFYPQGFPFYPQGYSDVGTAQQSLPVAVQPFGPAFPHYHTPPFVYPGIASPDYLGTQQSNYWNPSNPTMNRYHSLIPPKPFPAQPLSPSQLQTGSVPSALYNPQYSASAPLSPPPQFVRPPLAPRVPSAFAYRVPLPSARPPPPLRSYPALARAPAAPARVYPASTQRDPVALVSSAAQSPDTFTLSEEPESGASDASVKFDKKTSALKGQKSKKSLRDKSQATEEITELDI
ncbi:uncharacterized protein LOC120315158 isoform X2 [Crotalus tigris]|uniref:uncharacterized protein LOC120315158 isoform X2 n=1 Tax=Crotalus tigris TaxID=88082 RepID=UPI00192F3FD4|nr:uncharacterized protein LOC120315158 isoform X2 [Crotalus tigris]